MIHVIAEIEVQPGKRDDFLAAFHAVVPHVLAEDGCIEYGATVDAMTPIGRQAPMRENLVTIVEKWRDVPALEAHLAAAHMDAYRREVRELISTSILRILAPA